MLVLDASRRRARAPLPLFVLLRADRARASAAALRRATSATATSVRDPLRSSRSGCSLSPVPFAIDQVPEKWQRILSLNPMTAVITGFRWCGARRAEPVGAGRRERRGRRASCFVAGLAYFRCVRAALRGHDLMAASRSRSKGSSSATASASCQAAYGTLRDSLAHARRRLRRPRAQARLRGDLGARGRLVRGRRGRGARHHRPQRRRQVDAAQAPVADHRRRRRAGRRSAAASAACSRSAPASTPS